MNKGRTPRPVRRMGTEIHEDRRTKRRRTRAAEELADIQYYIDEAAADDDADADARDSEFDFYVQAWENMIGGDID